MTRADPRRRIPRTDALLAVSEIADARTRLGDSIVREAIRTTQEAARCGALDPEQVEQAVIDTLSAHRSFTARPVVNATGVVVHTNLGRAPLSATAIDAMVAASSYVDVELDLDTGTRSRRGAATRAALLRACPAAGDALMVNNGAAALVLVSTALAAGRAVVISRGEMIEIGAGFRLTDLIASTGARLHEIGTTNRTHLRDYADALATDDVGCILKVHPSNYRIQGFTTSVELSELAVLGARHGVPVVADIGSGLLQPDSLLPDEPDATTTLTAGADLVVASGDKLLGGPQAGLLFGDATLVGRIAKHPLARAVRADKLALAAMEATVDGPPPPVQQYLHADPATLRTRAEAIGAALGFPVVEHDGRVGGGGAPGVPLHGWAIRLPETLDRPLRHGDPPILTRVHDGACLLDLRCVPPSDDDRVLEAVRHALAASRT
ncbi:L-seryl-tRNA(Sec) selenium transferase [Gordonia sp. NPDC003424]